MRKFGKYEKMRRNALIQTYVTSLVCLALCVTMFFGTTMAWFTSEVTSEGNEMYVGTLDVELNHASFKGGALQLNDNSKMNKVEQTYKIFKDDTNWEPGYTAVEKFELVENGDLAFNYLMNIECDFTATDGGADQETKEAIAKAITVWRYVGTDANVTALPDSFNEMISTDWEEIGTLYDVIVAKLPVFSGKMAEEAVTATTIENETNVPAPAKAYHMIALHMDEDFDGAITKDSNGKITESVQGQTLDNITIKLVATQMANEIDAFGSEYDPTFYETVVVTDVAEAAGKFDMNSNVAAYMPVGETGVAQIALHGTGESDSSFALIGHGTTFSEGLEITSHANLQLSRNAVLTIEGITVNGTLKVTSYFKNIVIKNVKAKGIEINDNGNVTIENCQLDGAADNGIYLVGATNGYNVTLKNNVIKNAGKNAVQIAGSATGATYGAGKIVVEGNTFENWCQVNDKPRAAFKIWGDSVYAPEDITNTGSMNDAAKILMESVGQNNTFNGSGTNIVKFDVYGFLID